MSTRRVDSSTPASRITMPSWAARPVPTSSAVGVASPRAHGQAITSTATAAVNPPVGSPARPTPRRSATASPSTTGTKTDETRSASRCTGALVDWACRTRSAILATAVSRPTRVTSTTSRPSAFTLAPTTSSPGPRSTGTLSPVSIDSSTEDRPSRIRPSVATCSPGRTRKRIPGRSTSTATSRSVPSSSSRVASWAPSSSSARSADPARSLARASAQRPSSRKVVTVAATST